MVWDWIFLARLHSEAGQLARARQVADKATDLARTRASTGRGTDEHRRDLSAALDELGNVLVAAGDPAGARKYFDESLAILRELEASGRLLPGDKPYIQRLEALLAKGT